MKRSSIPAFVLVFLFQFVLALAVVQAGDKKPLDHESYDLWNTLAGQKISPDGNWVLCYIKPGKGDSELLIRHTASDKSFSQVRAAGAQFTQDSRFALYRVLPDKKAKDAKDRAAPVAQLHIVDLQSGDKTTIDRVRSFTLPAKAGGWVAYAIGEDEKKDEKADAEKNGKPQKGRPPVPAKKIAPKKAPPTELVLRNLATGAETRFADVVSYAFSKNGEHLAFVTSSKDDKNSGVFVVNVGNGNNRHILSGKGEHRSLAFAECGTRLAFLVNREAEGGMKKEWSVCYWQAPMKTAQPIVTAQSDGLPDGCMITGNGAPSFSRDGKRLFFSTVPRPEEPRKEEPRTSVSGTGKEPRTSVSGSSSPKVNVDIWHWKDPFLQPQQHALLKLQRLRHHRAVLHLESQKVVVLEDEDLPSVTVGDEGEADIAVGSTIMPYRMESSWDFPNYQDVFLIDVQTGKRQRLLKKNQGGIMLSPEAKYLVWWDPQKLAWMAMSTQTRKIVNLSKRIPHPVHNELHDQPAKPGPYGHAGWLKGDSAFLIYDKHDVWAVDPASSLPAHCVTGKAGRAGNLRFRIVTLDSTQRSRDPEEPLLLSATNLQTKASGFYRGSINSSQLPKKLIFRNENLSFVQKAEQADKVIFTCSTFQKFPDLWTADLNFKNPKQLTDANPQQAKYRWGTAELVQWTSLDGVKLNGLLYKPENFDPKKKYPMLVYFYERLSDNLHRHFVPAAGGSSINVSFYVSRGYVVFIPDIAYRVGQPGQSCVNSVLPGVTSIVNKGFVDPKKIGVQGHSWGGYQISYLLTKTKMFAAAEAGAPVSNMTSAYGGIRWTTGKSRMFQYEKTQSRIGGTLWEAHHRYIENSPLFWADHIHTPLLMMHNDEDGAVPWYQGIELFVALRRLGKPCWMLNYNGEDHGLKKEENRRDWAIRMQQFFDHYLKGEPAPRWLSHGVPAEQKGKTLGLEPVGAK